MVEHCNLNCQGCTHFSQLADKEFLDIKDFEKDIKRLYELSNGEIDRFNLMGGEPLLHPNCEAFFEVTRKYFKNSIIQLVTNGVLLLKKEKTFWESMKNNDITLAPTKYPINVDWEKVDKLCQEYGIKFKFFNNVNFDKFSWKFPINFNGTENPNWNFRNCGLANWCLFLDHGKLYTCTLPPVIRHFNKFFNKNIPVSNNDYIY